MPVASRLLIRRTAVAILAASAAFALTACVDDGAGPQLPTESATPSPTATTTDPTAVPTVEPDPLAISCAELVDPDAVYAFDPNYALIGQWDPPAGTLAADAISFGGLACQWVRESGGGTIDLSVARLSESELLEQKNAAFASSQMVPTYGEEAYFSTEGGIGTAIVFQGPYWLVISSESFAEPGEPTGIIESALAAVAAL